MSDSLSTRDRSASESAPSSRDGNPPVAASSARGKESLPNSPASAEPASAEPASAEPAATEYAGSRSESGASTPRPLTPSRWLLFNVLLPLVLLGIGGLAIWLLGTAEPTQRPMEQSSRFARMRALDPVRVTPIQSLSETGESLRLKVDGTVVPYREVQVATEVAGEIVFKSEACEAGSYVRKGTLLVRIDPTDYELEVEQYTRQQEQAYEAIREVDQEMVNTQKLIEMAKEDVELQSREVQRLQALPAGFSSEGELDRARRALLQANQQKLTHENQLETLLKRRSSLEASERLAATELRAANVKLKRTEIRAPIEGVVVREDAEMNSFVSRGNAIVTIEDTSKVEVSTNLRMDQLYWVMNQAGRSLTEAQAGYELPPTEAMIEYELSGRDGATYRWNGRLRGYDGIGLDPQTRTVPVRVVVDAPQRYVDQWGHEQQAVGPTTLVRGMYVRVLLKLQPQSDLWVIPARALKPGNRVWAFDPDESAAGGETSGVGSDAEPASPSDFEPAGWIAGRVTVVDSVFPVDTFTPANGGRRGRSGDADTQYWICEDRSGRLRSGALVVVSPLGTVNEEGVPVRAEVERGIDSDDEPPRDDHPAMARSAREASR